MNMHAVYEETSLGRPAVFLLPSDKMGLVLENDKTCRETVQEHLGKLYGGYTDEGNGHSGYWQNDLGTEFHDKYQKYRVSFLGKENIPVLKAFLAWIALQIKEEAIYLETGEDSCLIKPKN